MFGKKFRICGLDMILSFALLCLSDFKDSINLYNINFLKKLLG